MSDYEQHIGRIKPVEKKYPEDFQAYTRRVFGSAFREEVWKEYEASEKDEDDLFTLIDDCILYKKAFFIQDVWYVVTETKKVDPYDDIQELIPQDDGSFIYVMRFYNGGTCLSELIEEAIEKLKTKK
jgi:hypothetical protein